MVRGHDHKVDRLRAVYLFQRCSAKELKKLAGIADEVEYRAGHVLCAEGDHASECFVIIDGEAEVRHGDRVVRTVGSGASVGEMGLLNHKPRSATVVATSALSAYVIDGRRFGGLLEEAPGLSRALLEELSDRLRTLDAAYSQPTPV